MKKIVHFTKAQIFTWPGTDKEYADVWPIDNPDTLRVSNNKAALTSQVISSVRDASGNIMEFETQNTIYRLKVE